MLDISNGSIVLILTSDKHGTQSFQNVLVKNQTEAYILFVYSSHYIALLKVDLANPSSTNQYYVLSDPSNSYTINKVE